MFTKVEESMSLMSEMEAIRTSQIELEMSCAT